MIIIIIAPETKATHNLELEQMMSIMILGHETKPMLLHTPLGTRITSTCTLSLQIEEALQKLVLALEARPSFLDRALAIHGTLPLYHVSYVF